MYRIMIVDDEPLILAGITSLLDWEQYQCRVVGKASNGQQALGLLDTLNPDIIITDIKMPAMDGITFMKEAAKRGNHATFIILTNLEEFSLAKQALQLGAVDYLVKLELDEDALVNALNKAVSRCDWNRERGLLREEQELFESTLDEKMQNYFRQVLVYDSDASAEAGLLDAIAERFHRSVLMLINFNYGFEGFSQEFTREDQKKLIKFAENIISEMVKGFFKNSCILRREQNGFVLVLSLEEGVEYQEQIEIMSRKFRQVMKDYFEVSISIAVSQAQSGRTFCKWQDLLYQAMSAMNYTYYESTEAVIFYSRQCEGNEKHSSNFNINFLKKDLTAAVRQNDSEQFCDIMNQVIALFQECRPSRTQAVNACSNLYYFITTLIEDRKESPFPYAVDIVGQLNRMDSLKTIIRWLEGFRDETEKNLEFHRDCKLDKNIELAQKYVLEHYQEKITLGQVADALNISQGHLSSSFKKHTGMKFSDYVTEVKIEKAKELIETYQYMMYEISDMLGFDTQYYFSTVFKKITGYTPKEYETMCLAKNPPKRSEDAQVRF